MYEGRYTKRFKNRLEEPPFNQLKEKISEKCQMILQHPLSACKSELLKHSYKGKRSGRLDRQYRIIYTVCSECHKQGYQEANLLNCPDCKDVPMETVTFLDITDHYRI